MSTSASVASYENYRAQNEPVYDYLPGSKERIALDAKLKEYDSKVHEIPIVIGDQEITTKDVLYQVRVSFCLFYQLKINLSYEILLKCETCEFIDHSHHGFQGNFFIFKIS